MKCERDEAFLGAMEKFIKTTVGNNYNISLRKLLFRKKTVKGGGGSTPKTQDDLNERQFFCSELIAKAYKECGLLTTDFASCQFMPADFSKESGKLGTLQKGA